MARHNWSNEKLMQRILDGTSEKARWLNIRVLRSRTDREIFDWAVKLLKSGNGRKQSIGIAILSQLAGEADPYATEIRAIFLIS
jgi:hypothetical protein